MAIDPVDPLKATVANGVASTQKLIFDDDLGWLATSRRVIDSIHLFISKRTRIHDSE